MFIPHTCPSCDSKLERVKDQLFCRNSLCPAQNAKIVEGFCKRLKIKGFGPKTIEKLALESISDLYNLDYDKLVDSLGTTMATKLHAEIANKTSLQFGMFIGALGIPLIGTVAGNKLGSFINSWDQVSKEICKDAGLGEKATDSLLNWLASEQGLEVRELPIQFLDIHLKPKTEVSVEAKGDVVITGKLDNFKNRAEAASFLESLGYSVKSAVTKKTIALIVEDGSTSSKTVKANDYGIPIVTITELTNSK